MRQLVRHVSVRNPETSYVYSFGPGDDVPEWAAELITNPDNWSQPDTSTPLNEPPRTSAHARRDDWAAYATSLGIMVRDDWKRDDIIAAVDHRTKAP